mmetsp:Transcript_125954/g.367996  ORF Transcript_125954/g.367996 Transcript_125954/m.367996 type:complete len:400 (+) Transcript_125954:542-1741(+)
MLAGNDNGLLALHCLVDLLAGPCALRPEQLDAARQDDGVFQGAPRLPGLPLPRVLAVAVGPGRGALLVAPLRPPNRLLLALYGLGRQHRRLGQRHAQLRDADGALGDLLYALHRCHGRDHRLLERGRLELRGHIFDGYAPRRRDLSLDHHGARGERQLHVLGPDAGPRRRGDGAAEAVLEAAQQRGVGAELRVVHVLHLQRGSHAGRLRNVRPRAPALSVTELLALRCGKYLLVVERLCLLLAGRHPPVLLGGRGLGRAAGAPQQLGRNLELRLLLPHDLWEARLLHRLRLCMDRRLPCDVVSEPSSMLSDVITGRLCCPDFALLSQQLLLQRCIRGQRLVNVSLERLLLCIQLRICALKLLSVLALMLHLRLQAHDLFVGRLGRQGGLSVLQQLLHRG